MRGETPRNSVFAHGMKYKWCCKCLLIGLDQRRLTWSRVGQRCRRLGMLCAGVACAGEPVSDRFRVKSWGVACWRSGCWLTAGLSLIRFGCTKPEATCACMSLWQWVGHTRGRKGSDWCHCKASHCHRKRAGKTQMSQPFSGRSRWPLLSHGKVIEQIFLDDQLRGQGEWGCGMRWL